MLTPSLTLTLTPTPTPTPTPTLTPTLTLTLTLTLTQVEPMLATILRALRSEIEKLLAERLARQHSTGRNQAAFLINNYDLIVSLLAERGARGEDSLHFEQLLDSIKATFVETLTPNPNPNPNPNPQPQPQPQPQP